MNILIQITRYVLPAVFGFVFVCMQRAGVPYFGQLGSLLAVTLFGIGLVLFFRMMREPS